MNSRAKIIPLEQLPSWRDAQRRRGAKLVVTNGCFDILHAGHVGYLEAARARGDALLVGLNGDASVRRLKGPGRPINSEEDRAFVLSALACVDAVSIFPEPDAARFLQTAQPDVYVKGGDYSLETLHPEERAILEKSGAEILLLPLLPGRSTTALLRKLSLAPGEQAG